MEAPRSARIAISMSMNDPDKALVLTRDLGDLVIERDAQIRRERYEMEQRVRGEAVSFAETELARLQRDWERIIAVYPGASPDRKGELRVEAAGVERTIVAVEARLKDAMNAKRRLELESSSDKMSLALRYERVDWGAAKHKIDQTFVLVRAIILALLGLFPVVAMGVGAFDRRIYDERDVARMGFKPLGLMRKAAMREARS